MITKIYNSSSKKIKNCIYELLKYSFCECLYLYSDLKHYGFESKCTTTWVQTDSSNEISAILLKYANGLNLFQPINSKTDFDELNTFIEKVHPDIINTKASVADKIKLKDYQKEYGNIAKLETQIPVTHLATIPTHSQIQEIATLLTEDKTYGTGYDKNELSKQMIEREKGNFSRSLIITKDRQVAAHVNTGGECREFAVVSGVFTKEEYRHKGLATAIVKEMCGLLQSENKQVYIIHFTKESGEMYKKIGFIDVCGWSKLFVPKKV